MAINISFIHSILIFVFSAFTDVNDEGKIVELPLTRVSGYGTAIPGLAPLSWRKKDTDDPWAKCIPTVTGVPTEWGSDYIQNFIMIDPIQFAYQNHLAGNMSDSYYDEVKKSWGVHFFSNVVNRQVKSHLNIIYRKTAQGGIVYRVDEDNDCDFSDEKDYVPVKNIWPKIDSLAKLYMHTIRYERITAGQVVPDNAPLMLVEHEGKLCRNFPAHYEARVDGTSIEVASINFVSFDFTGTTISLPAQNSGIINQGDFFSIKGKMYKFINVDRSKMLLRIQEVNREDMVYSSQVGFQAHTFKGANYITGTNVSSATYKGKYMYVDFWGTWCGPCMAELPHIKQVYETVDTTKVQFIGIAVDSDSKSLDKVIAKEKISWPQIQVEGDDEGVRKFNINKYPSSFLIDPTGKIVAKDLPHQSLRDSLNKYVMKK